jgi:hypothetical protein
MALPCAWWLVAVTVLMFLTAAAQVYLTLVRGSG